MAAKHYGKKGGGMKSYKKKTFKKTFKKTGTASMSKKLKMIVAGEVQRALTSGAQNLKRKVTMDLVLQNRDIYINGKTAMLNCLRLPITDAIPAQSGCGQPSDVRRRQSNKIMVTGVNVRVSLSASDQTRLMLLPYEPHDSVKQQLNMTPLELQPSALAGYVPEQFATVMRSHHTLGLVSKHGPLMTKKSGDNIALDTSDNTPFECRVSTHAGKPIGTVQRKVYGTGTLKRTVNWDHGGNSKGVGAGFTAWSKHTFNEYWKLNKEYTYMHEVVNEQLFERGAEMLMYVDCPSMQSVDIDESTPLVGAVLHGVIVDIYYHDM